jgi:hypothetical protein
MKRNNVSITSNIAVRLPRVSDAEMMEMPIEQLLAFSLEKQRNGNATSQAFRAQCIYRDRVGNGWGTHTNTYQLEKAGCGKNRLLQREDWD